MYGPASKRAGARLNGARTRSAASSASLQRLPDDKLTVIVLCNSNESNISTTLAKAIANLCISE